MKKFFKLILGLLMLPLCWSLSRTVFFLLRSVPADAVSDWSALVLPAGFALWLLMFFLLPKPFRTYVLAHEMTHAVWGLVMGAKIGRMKIGRSGGHVELSKSNFLISLAPYFFPFYTGLVIALWYVAGIFWDLSAYELWWMGLIGFTWGFHITFTLYMLSQHQPDVHENGRMFSYVVIYSLNLVFVALWLVLVGTPSFVDLSNLLYQETVAAYAIVWTQAAAGWIRLVSLLNAPA